MEQFDIFRMIAKSHLAMTSLMAVMAMAGSSGVQAADYWIAAVQSGCQVWSDEPLEDLTLDWSGACSHQRANGEGTLVIIQSGVTIGEFTGIMLDGKASGNGTLEVTTADGFRYTGSFEAGKIQGFGVYDAADGSRYEGQFFNDLPHGFGRYENKDSTVYIGDVAEGEASGYGMESLASGERYEGQFANSQRNGLGMMKYVNGDLYFGQFANDQPQGMGRLEATDGSVYQGNFQDGKAHGPGTYIASDDAIYQGHFTGGKADGKFLVTLTDGSFEIQTWHNDERVE
jgi:hypothetical protein